MAIKYNLEPRFLAFNKKLFKELRIIKKDKLNEILINQLARSSTSVGANYIEANGSVSFKEFKHKIFLCKKEINGSKYWLQLLIEDYQSDELKDLLDEAEELRLIFNKISNKLRSSEKQ